MPRPTGPACLTVLDMGLLATLLIAFPSPSFAYLDPGAGSAAIQVIVAALAGLAVAFRVYFHQVKTFFSSLFRRDGDKGDSK